MKCAIITGASKGIGKAIALQLSNDLGCHILLNYASDTKAAQDTLTQIQEQGGSGELLQFKVQDKAAVDRIMKDWWSKNPDKHVEVLVNNAGIAKDGLFMWMPEEDWDAVVDVSLKGMFNVTQSVIQQMLRRRSGRIINISSLSGLKGLPGQTNYAAAKAAMIGATKALAEEIAKRNVTVNAIAPGFIETEMIKDLDLEKYLAAIPMGRLGNPEEIAYLVSFLASDRASYITGEVININGGLYS